MSVVRYYIKYIEPDYPYQRQGTPTIDTTGKKLLISNTILWITFIILWITLLITFIILWIKKEKETKSHLIYKKKEYKE